MKHPRLSNRFGLVLLLVLALLGTGIAEGAREVLVARNLDGGVILLVVLVCLVLATACYVLNLGAHEAAHGLVGAMVGLRVFLIQIGRGPLLYEGRWFGTRIEVRALIYYYGLTRLGSFHAAGYRHRLFTAISAGPLMNALILYVSLECIEAPERIENLGQAFLLTLAHISAWTNGAFLAASLIPSVFPIGDELVPSDGLQLLRIPFLPVGAIAEYCASSYTLEAHECFQAKDTLGAEAWVELGLAAYPEDLGLAFYRAALPVFQHDYATGLKRGRALLLRQDLSPLFRALTADLMAHALLLHVRLNRGTGIEPDTAAGLREVQRFCELALADRKILSRSQRYSCRATRGSLWIEQGELEEGVRELQEVLKHTAAAESRSIVLSYLALAEGRRGDTAVARDYLARARATDPESPLPASVERDLGAAAQRNPRPA